MKFYEVAPTKIIRSGVDVLTYASENSLANGTLVTIPVGSKDLVGLIIREVVQPEFSTKPISSVLYDTPLPDSLLQLTLWLASYYQTPLATVLQTVLPSGLTKKRRITVKNIAPPLRNRTQILFNSDQKKAIKTISDSPVGTFLLHGVTGSGKTEIYKELAKQAVKNGKSVIILTPEIALTPQLVAEFNSDFPDLIISHSGQTEAERHLNWLTALNADKPIVAIGPRSALFLPLKNLGLIVVDEAHEPSYKQDKAPRYLATRAATILGKAANADVILGSATPDITDYYLAQNANRPIINLPKPAIPGTKKPQTVIIDLKARANFKNHRFLSDKLLTAIETALASKQQVLIFHNRRGSSSLTLCENCGWTAECPNCFLPLTLHTDSFELICHSCGHKEKVPSACPVCHHAGIIHKGIGTKLIESELKKLFPKAKVARFDGDNSHEETLDKQYQALYDGQIDIAIGTQVVAKGLDLPHLKLVAVIQADSGLSLPDYVARERTFQLLSQVVGRVGRRDGETEVIVQTYQPTHPSITAGIAQDYATFYESELAERKRANLPPFVYLAKLTDVYKTEAIAAKNARELAKKLKSDTSNIQILGPTPAFYERVGGTYRWQLTLKSKQRSNILEAAKLVPNQNWQIDLDASSLL